MVLIVNQQVMLVVDQGRVIKKERKVRVRCPKKAKVAAVVIAIFLPVGTTFRILLAYKRRTNLFIGEDV
jgi:hypothetical protein